MVTYVSRSEEKSLKRLGIVGVALVSIVSIFQIVFMFVGQHYLIISLGTTLLSAVLQGRAMPVNLLFAFSTVVLAWLFVGLLLERYLFDKFPHSKGKLTLIFGIGLAFFSSYLIIPIVVNIG